MTEVKTQKVALVYLRGIEYFMQVCDAIAAHRSERYNLRIGDFSIANEKDIPENLAQWQPNGALCFLGPQARAAYNLIVSLNIPFVNISADYATEGVYSVYADMNSIGQLAIKHFMAGGMEHVAFIGVKNRPGGSQRWQSFLKLAIAAGLPEPTSYFLASEPSDNRDRVLSDNDFVKWIKNLPHNTGILCLDDEIGHVACQVALQNNRSIPADLAVLGVDDTRICSFTDPPLSSIQLPVNEIADAAAHMLDELMTGRIPEQRVCQIPVQKITVRSSTRAAAAFSDDIEMHRILKMIEEKAVHGLGVEELVATLNCSRVTFEKRFRALTGLSPGDAIRRTKLARAEALLRETDINSTQIAKMCGYENLSNFCNRFRATHGESPQSFRRRHRGS